MYKGLLKTLIWVFLVFNFFQLLGQSIDAKNHLVFDSINYVTKLNAYNYLHINSDSIKFSSLDHYGINIKGVSLKNKISNQYWDELLAISNEFYNDPPTRENYKITHTVPSRLEWYLKDSLVYHITFHARSPVNKRLIEIHELLLSSTKFPNNKYWSGIEECNSFSTVGFDSIVIRKYDNSLYFRYRRPRLISKYYDGEYKYSENLKVLESKKSKEAFMNIISSHERINPYQEQISSYVATERYTYIMQFYKNGGSVKHCMIYKNYLRSSNLCWIKIRRKNLLKQIQNI